jgi:hypothetical protein
MMVIKMERNWVALWTRMIVGDRLYLPFGALQIIYPSFVDLPKSLIFVSLPPSSTWYISLLAEL